MNIEKPRAGLGASSVLLIIVILCLTAFSALAFITARVDQRLTDRTIEAQLAYYEADAAAQSAIAQLHAALAAGEALPDGWAQADGAYAQQFPFGESMVLEVVAEHDGGACRIVCYRVRNDAEWNSQTQWTLW